PSSPFLEPQRCVRSTFAKTTIDQRFDWGRNAELRLAQFMARSIPAHWRRHFIDEWLPPMARMEKIGCFAGLRTTQAATSSPHRESGIPNTAASRTAGLGYRP